MYVSIWDDVGDKRPFGIILSNMDSGVQIIAALSFGRKSAQRYHQTIYANGIHLLIWIIDN